MKRLLNWIKRKLGIIPPSPEPLSDKELQDVLSSFQIACGKANETLPTSEELCEQMRACFGVKQPSKVMAEFWEKNDPFTKGIYDGLGERRIE